MYAIALFAALTLSPAQSEAAPPEPGPVESLEATPPPAVEAAEPAADDAGASEDTAEGAPAPPLPPAAEPAAPEPAAPAAPVPEADSAEEEPAATTSTEPPGMSPFTTRLMQLGIGCGLTALSSVCCFAPYANLIGAPLVLCLGPAITTTTHVVAAETFGSERGTLCWPILTAYGIELLTVAGAIGALVGTAFALYANTDALNDVFRNIRSSTDPAVAIGAALGALLIPTAVAGAIYLVGGVLSVAVPALVYGWTAVAKAPDDTDFRLPGLFSPNLPEADVTEDDDDGDTSGAAPAVSMAY